MLVDSACTTAPDSCYIYFIWEFLVVYDILVIKYLQTVHFFVVYVRCFNKLEWFSSRILRMSGLLKLKIHVVCVRNCTTFETFRQCLTAPCLHMDINVLTSGPLAGPKSTSVIGQQHALLLLVAMYIGNWPNPYMLSWSKVF